MTEHLNRQQRAADWANDGVDRVPDRIEPWNLVCEEFKEIENAGDADNPRVAENFERLILRREGYPMKMNCKPGGKNGEVKIDASQSREAEGNREEIQSFHEGNIRPG